MKFVGRQVMVPTADLGWRAALHAVLYNCERFDRVNFDLWLNRQDESTRKLARRCPPNRVYALQTDAPAEQPVYGIVLGYRAGELAVQVLGVVEGNGSHESPVMLPADALVDVTDQVRVHRILR